MNKDYIRASVVAPYIDELLAEKRLLGYSYSFEEYVLNCFDDYCIKKNLTTPNFDRNFLEEWLMRKEQESSSYHSQRISFVRQLTKYINSHGGEAYVPIESVKKETSIPHVLSTIERISFFKALDSTPPKSSNENVMRMWNEYKIMFRMLYCCGMRLAEVCNLRTQDVNLKDGILTIYHSKGDKDRLVYIADDLQELLVEYESYLVAILGFLPYWMFPGNTADKHVDKSTLDNNFNKIWCSIPSYNSEQKKPTVHCLRHSFVVDRINSWSSDDINIEYMMPYLSKYLGHSNPMESFYYYHLNEDSNRIIRSKDSTANEVIPEVSKYEF